jgi:hypothetical protein
MQLIDFFQALHTHILSEFQQLDLNLDSQISDDEEADTDEDEQELDSRLYPRLPGHLSLSMYVGLNLFVCTLFKFASGLQGAKWKFPK